MKKRFTHPLLDAKRERQAKQSATLAVRQSAGLSRSEKRALRPLTETARSHDGSAGREIKFPIDWLDTAVAQWHKSFQNQIQSMWAIPSSMALGGVGRNTRFMIESGSAIDAGKLEALKLATPNLVAPRVPDMVQCITGWRGWKLKNGLLGALGVDEVWPIKQPLRAVCKNGSGESHLAPQWSCRCGIWAFKDVGKLVAALDLQYSTVVIGSVSLWGKVIETENGYRAQYAYPSELWLLDDSLEELGLIYDVPVRR